MGHLQADKFARPGQALGQCLNRHRRNDVVALTQTYDGRRRHRRSEMQRVEEGQRVQGGVRLVGTRAQKCAISCPEPW